MDHVEQRPEGAVVDHQDDRVRENQPQDEVADLAVELQQRQHTCPLSHPHRPGSERELQAQQREADEAERHREVTQNPRPGSSWIRLNSSGATAPTHTRRPTPRHPAGSSSVHLNIRGRAQPTSYAERR